MFGISNAAAIPVIGNSCDGLMSTRSCFFALTRLHAADRIWSESGSRQMSERNPKLGPLEDAAVAHAAADVVRKAHAVGLTDESPDFTGLTYLAVKRTVLRVREAGIGERAAGYIALATGDDTTLLAERLRE